ncbi:MAG: hypothetical protein A2V52_03115 [Actinobacteria bacterium RBG_19FT_COMBO_54_7]|uniref:4Fe-4S ferredoxin-type domain-containing protein n=1 Tax=Candidatus Solincola sediminis TaxID=1797199 RepID=A0A1F2WFM5_9ACTN|nr:MAG: hypothetical protein A2Y75_05600 [Candidatus Solincola sediminis]OFW58083.1 MAG: hypothetical protein A2W01_02220 [Candidatus Solincola sediminis]OFW65826.1 MAG: hypothetical protein A2V52_03115 [Actinobacteria bacterium RBG_19FT_COMBO_54_7]
MVEEVEPVGLSIEIDEERCIRCLECIDICPQSGEFEYPVFIEGPERTPEVANPESCILCRSCEVNCRAMAIKVEEENAVRKDLFAGEVRAENKNRAMF